MVQFVAEMELALMCGVLGGCFVWITIVWPIKQKRKERELKWNLKSE